MRKITVPEEVQIPGTDYILEKGDKVEVQLEENFDEVLASLNEVSEVLRDYASDIAGNDWQIIKENLEHAMGYIRRMM